jgi:hypothetical protein
MYFIYVLTALSLAAQTIQGVSKVLGQMSAVPHTKTTQKFPPTVSGVQSNNVWTLIRVFWVAGTFTTVVELSPFENGETLH